MCIGIFLCLQINYQEPDKNQTFLHILLESAKSAEEVEAGLQHLLEQGADLTLKCKFRKNGGMSGDEVLPIHVAVKMQDEMVRKLKFLWQNH